MKHISRFPMNFQNRYGRIDLGGGKRFNKGLREGELSASLKYPLLSRVMMLSMTEKVERGAPVKRLFVKMKYCPRCLKREREREIELRTGFL